MTPIDKLDEVIENIASKIASKSGAAIAAGKEIYYRQLEMGLSEAYDFAGERMAGNMMFRDANEGIDAFIEKRKPVWNQD